MVSKFIPSSVSTVSTNPYQLHIYLHIYLYISIYPYLHPQLQLIEKPQAQGFLKRLPWRSSHRGRLHKDLHTGSHQPVSEESGLIDKFKSLLFQFFPHGDPSKFASLVFRVFDENNVGKLFLQPLLHCYIVTLLHWDQAFACFFPGGQLCSLCHLFSDKLEFTLQKTFTLC